MGQLFMMGFDGTSVSPQIRSLIEDYHLGSVLLSAKNLKCIASVSHPSKPNSAFYALGKTQLFERAEEEEETPLP